MPDAEPGGKPCLWAVPASRAEAVAGVRLGLGLGCSCEALGTCVEEGFRSNERQKLLLASKLVRPMWAPQLLIYLLVGPRALAELRPHPDAPNALYAPVWEASSPDGPVLQRRCLVLLHLSPPVSSPMSWAASSANVGFTGWGGGKGSGPCRAVSASRRASQRDFHSVALPKG